jgi:hypothetical protein
VLATGECTRYTSELYLGRARARLALGEPAAAVADCALAIETDYHEQAHWPCIVRARALHAHEPYLVRAEVRLALGEAARALSDCFLAASIRPEEPTVYDLRAGVYYAIGNLQEVIQDTLRADYLQRKAGATGAERAGAPDRLVGATPEPSRVWARALPRR